MGVELAKPGIDVKEVRDLAEKEIKEERTKAAKDKIKSKLKEIDKAELVVRNLKRELEDLYLEIAE